MTTGNESAYPKQTPDGDSPQKGLTKREHFAAMAMQGLMSTLVPDSGNWCPNLENVKYCADMSVTSADELIAALNKS